MKRVVLMALAAGMARSQTTQGVIAGRLVDAATQELVAGAVVACYRDEPAGTERSPSRRTVSRDDGYFALPLLAPGPYRLIITGAGYQAVRVHEIPVTVAGSVWLPVEMRPLSSLVQGAGSRSVALRNGSILQYFGLDFDPAQTGEFTPPRGSAGVLETSRSDVVESEMIRRLPLAGRDAYAILALLPGVVSDAGTSRGLGLVLNGQNPAASNYLLDGLENNNYLTSGPLVTVAPEAIGEYRVSASSYSAEYGRTAGYVANTMTRAGDGALHLLAYGYLKNDWLNANEFQRNALGQGRPPLKEFMPGMVASGPIGWKRLYGSLAVEYGRLGSRGEARGFLVPGSAFVRGLNPGARIAKLLAADPPPAPQISTADGRLGFLRQEPTITTRRMLLLPRLDWDAGEGRDKVSLRAPVNVFRRPDFIWSPYRNSAAPLESSVRGLAGSWIRSRRSGVAYELRAGLTSAGISVNRRAGVEEGRDWAVPLLTVNPGENLPCPDCLGEGMKLPGTLSAFGYDNQALNLELSGNILLQAGKHSWKLGSGWLRRRQSGGIRAGADGTYSFESLAKLATDQPSSVLLALPRSLAGEPQALRQVDDGHRYGQDQFFGFLQDSLRVWPRVYLNLGVRYENFGSPRSLSGSDVGLEFDPALPLSQALPGASLLRLSNIYRSDGNNIAGRLGFTVMLDKAGRSLLRAGGGTFFDRPIDNLWLTAQLNGQVRRDGRFPAGSTVDVLRYLPQLTPQTSLFSSLSALGSAQPEITAVAPNLRSAAAHHAFLGFELHWLPGVTVHLNGQTALGRGLVTTDLVNRVNSVTPRVGNATGRLFAAIPNNIAFRANQGTSAYYGANASIRWTGQRVNLLASYSLSHLLDNQSESLAGDFFDLRATAGNTPGERYVSAFTRQFNSGADRARSDFDQRHNLTAAAILLLPGRRWRSGWSLAPIAAVRSGFPFTVLGQEAGGNPFAPTIANNRANLLDPVAARVNQAVNGGRVLLNEAAFSPPGRGSLGTSGRNNFRGPGFVSLDLSLAKAMQWRESRLTLRADAYNIANHQNLGAPSAYLGGSCRTCFGFAPVGRTGRTGQSLQVPFQETPRQIQLLLRIEF